jgi:hypothetical protein
MASAENPVELSVAILKKFREDSKQAIQKLKMSNVDSKLLKQVRRAHAKAEATLQKLVIELDTTPKSNQ